MSKKDLTDIEIYLRNNGFKKEFPDKVEPTFYWLVKKLPNKYFINLEINVNFREKTITVFTEELSSLNRLNSIGDVCIINKSFNGMNDLGAFKLIINILSIFKQ